jgi:uncharacterized BrkB/YihY/UPF0761 family membrane protein
MLSGLLSFLGMLAVAFAIDWLVCTRMAAYRTDYEYNYRPGAVRYAILFLVAGWAAYMEATYDPARQPIAGLVVSAGLLLAWAYLAWRDVERRLVPSNLGPKRYTETDYCP